jgi:hypothetical protein
LIRRCSCFRTSTAPAAAAPALDDITRLFTEQWAVAATKAALFPCA